jgi:hypothetical protein
MGRNVSLQANLIKSESGGLGANLLDEGWARINCQSGPGPEAPTAGQFKPARTPHRRGSPRGKNEVK